MTPAARVAAAIAVLDAIQSGVAAEKALTGWARGARYAGSKDRAAVRDHVFWVLRRKRSCAALGRGETGRALMLGALRQMAIDPDTMFTGQGHAPDPLRGDEREVGLVPDGAAAVDLPDFVYRMLCSERGSAETLDVAARLRDRAPLHLRVNLRRGSVAQARDVLAREGIETAPVALSPTALEVLEGARRVRAASPYLDGRVEIQDAASQAVCDAVALAPGLRALDYCAGGGGKTLALAARCKIESFAHDGLPGRMKDLPVRAARAGVAVTMLTSDAVAAAAPFDLVVADVPCSGSGAWRRQPEAKWRLDPERLAELVELQRRILSECAPRVAPGGRLVLMTCSLLRAENEAQQDWFVETYPHFSATEHRRISPIEGGDGLFFASFTRTG